MRIDQFIMSNETVDRLNDVLILFGLDGSVLDANSAALDCYEYSHTELLGLRINDIRAPQNLEGIDEQLREAADHGLLFETQDRRRDGEVFPVEVWLAPVSVGDEIALLSLVHDITDRRLAEKELGDSESRYRALAESSPLSILVTSCGKVSLVNAAAVELLGASSAADLIGRPTLELFHSDCQALVGECIAEGRDTAAAIEAQVLLADGTTTDVQAATSPFLDQDVRAVQVVLTDISERKAGEHAMRAALDSIIDVVGNISEMRDPYTAGHQRRVSELACEIASEMQMPDGDVSDIRVAGLMHDIGKMSVPSEILAKPRVLTPAEFGLVQGHSEAGFTVIEAAKTPGPVSELVYQHHERCDGSGYPRGLTAADLLAGSKVLMVADVVEAMMSHRPYRAALGLDAALAEIERGSGTLYDARVADACVRVFRERGFVFKAA